MPKLKNKTAVERQKSYNYTEKHDRLAKNVEMVKSGELEVSSATELMEKSGYNAPSDAKKQKGVIAIVNEVWSTQERAQDVKRITKAAEMGEQYTAALKGIDIANKMTGDYASIENKLTVEGHIQHDHELTTGTIDYLKFKQQQLENKEYIEGEIVTNE